MHPRDIDRLEKAVTLLERQYGSEAVRAECARIKARINPV